MTVIDSPVEHNGATQCKVRNALTGDEGYVLQSNLKPLPSSSESVVSLKVKSILLFPLSLLFSVFFSFFQNISKGDPPPPPEKKNKWRVSQGCDTACRSVTNWLSSLLSSLFSICPWSNIQGVSRKLTTISKATDIVVVCISWPYTVRCFTPALPVPFPNLTPLFWSFGSINA